MEKLKIGYIGLGRMGKNMVLRLLEQGVDVVAWNRSPGPLSEVVKYGAEKSESVKELVTKLDKPRVVWLMLPAGNVTDDYIDKLLKFLSRGDLIIDGSNSFYQDTLRRKQKINEKGIRFIDVGVSGGVEGARSGACLMIGGEKADFDEVEDVFKAASKDGSYELVGTAGAGHFVKMVHNGVEYGMMAAIAEGMRAIEKYSKELLINTKKVARIYANGSIIEGKLATLLEKVVNRPDFDGASGVVPKGETEEEMEKLESLSDMPILGEARKMRVKSRQKESYEGKIMALLRNEFGGHSTFKKKS